MSSRHAVNTIAVIAFTLIGMLVALLPDAWLARPFCRCAVCECETCGDGECEVKPALTAPAAVKKTHENFTPPEEPKRKPTARRIDTDTGEVTYFNPNTYARFMAMPYEAGVMFAVKENIPLAVCLQLEFDFPEGFSGEHVIAKLPTDPAKAAYFSRWTGDYVVLEPRDGKLYPAKNQAGCKACSSGR